MFARTDRLLLRPGWKEDAAALAAALDDPAIARMTRGVPHPYSLTDAEAHIARQQQARLPDLLAFARTNGAPRLIGGVALTGNNECRPLLGYWISRPHWGLGYATEAAAAMIAIAFDGLRLDEIQAEHFGDNAGSERVLRKLGFTATGLAIERACVARAEPATCQQYRLTAASRLSGDPQPLAA
jgi:RimJ/RimL family protein N-acetyltransferase